LEELLVHPMTFVFSNWCLLIEVQRIVSALQEWMLASPVLRPVIHCGRRYYCCYSLMSQKVVVRTCFSAFGSLLAFDYFVLSAQLALERIYDLPVSPVYLSYHFVCCFL